MNKVTSIATLEESSNSITTFNELCEFFAQARRLFKRGTRKALDITEQTFHRYSHLKDSGVNQILNHPDMTYIYIQYKHRMDMTSEQTNQHVQNVNFNQLDSYNVCGYNAPFWKERASLLKCNKEGYRAWLNMTLRNGDFQSELWGD